MSAQQSCELIKQHRPGFTPKVGLILGTGLGKLAEQITNTTVIPYAELPGFPVSTVQGHAGNLVLGELQGVPVICFQGRVHNYEGINYNGTKTMIRTLKLLGCENLILTNAAGAIRDGIQPGELMMITDHINFQPGNPLVGINDDEFGERFVPVDKAYTLELREIFTESAAALDINLHQGVYISVLGPNFETPAEIRAFRIWGADAVGMSTVPEVLVACHCGMKVAAFSAITNLAAGMTPDAITHCDSLHFGALAGEKLSSIISHCIDKIAQVN